MKRVVIPALVVVLVLFWVPRAQAEAFTMPFSVGGFTPVIASAAAPTDRVSGTIVYDVASATSSIT